MSCKSSIRKKVPEIVVYERNTRKEEIGFKPRTTQIDSAELRLLEYLDSKAKVDQTVFVNSLGVKVPLQDQLKYYKRRYFGGINNNGERILLIEFVFVRCGEQNEWKKINYTNDQTKGCWWSVKYSSDRNEIFDLQL